MQDYRAETYRQLQKLNLLDFIDVSFLNRGNRGGGGDNN